MTVQDTSGTSTGGTGSGLAFTGFPAGLALAAAGLLVALGTVLLVVARRRSVKPSHQ